MSLLDPRDIGRSPEPPAETEPDVPTWDDFCLHHGEKAQQFVLDAIEGEVPPFIVQAIEGDETKLYKHLPPNLRAKVDAAVEEWADNRAAEVGIGVYQDAMRRAR